MRVPVLGSLLARVLRYKRALSYAPPRQRRVLRWLFTSRETTNFTYDLTEANRRYLAGFVAVVSATPISEVEGFLEEIESDLELSELIKKRSSESEVYSRISDPVFRPGRRLGWYALVRALKPEVVVETGVDKGLGALVFTSALRRNAAEGRRGRYYGLDLNPYAGFLFAEPYTEFGELLCGDSLKILARFKRPIDLFIHDSDHSKRHERLEYEAVASKLAPGSIVLSDNAHETDELYRFAVRDGRSFLFFQESPERHWYPGGGIGVAFNSGSGRPGSDRHVEGYAERAREQVAASSGDTGR